MKARRRFTDRLSVPTPVRHDPWRQLPDGCIEAWFRSVDYSGTLREVYPGADPDLFFANNALENNMYVHSSLEPYRYNGEIDWALPDRTNSWYLWFQSLRVVGYLANAAEVSGESRYLEKAADIIESWHDFHYDRQIPPPYAWDDHAAASRTRNVLHFLQAYASLPEAHFPDALFQKVVGMLRQHGDWLSGETSYHFNNHGLMASIALTQLALVFPELDTIGSWKETGTQRIRERVKEDLSIEGVHMEHSPAYHHFFLILVLEAVDLFRHRGHALFLPGDATLEGMKRYLSYLLMPDSYLPQIGDTEKFRVRRHFDHPWVMYSLTAGKEGVRPCNTSMVYPDAGVAILRDEWKTGNCFAQTTYLMVQSSFTYHMGHKHADDLGLVLYSRGEDIFVGPGVYAYDSSRYRQYVRSAQAHNTLTVDGKSYALARDSIGKAGITAYRLDEAFDFVQGSHTMYDGVTLKRGIVFIRPSTILVIDEAISANEHAIQQIWNLSPAADALKFDRDGASWSVGENGVSVEIRQLRPTAGVNHYYGQDEPVRGFISRQQRELVPVHQLEFENHGNGVVFVTQISVTGPGEETPTIEVDLGNPYRSIVVRQDDGTTLTIGLEADRQSEA